MKVDRRSLLLRIVTAFSAVAIAGFSFPFIRSFFPGFDRDLTLDVDLSYMEPGDVKVVRWLGRNVMIIRRDPAVAGRLLAVDSQLADPASESSKQPEYAQNPYRSRRPEHLLVFSNCTHLGCEVALRGDERVSGFRCPCHRSDFDMAGRVLTGAAAKLNLEVPNYEYVGRSIIRLREV